MQLIFFNLKLLPKFLHSTAIFSWMQASLFALQIQLLPVQVSPEMPSFQAEILTQVKSEDFGLRSPDASELGWSSCLLHIFLPFLRCIFSKFNVSEIFWVCCSQYVHTYLSAQMSKSSLSASLNLSCLMANSCLRSSRSKNETECHRYLSKYSTPCFQTYYQ